MNKTPFAAIECCKGGKFMYDIMLAGQSVGKVTVEKQGLYYHFDCRCDLCGDVMYRIAVQAGDKETFLGIPAPENGKFVLRTKMPVKKFPDGNFSFRAVPKHARMDEMFVPISPEEPFMYLRRLQNAYLQVREGKVGVIIPPEQ
jgi:hypothetical protein